MTSTTLMHVPASVLVLEVASSLMEVVGLLVGSLVAHVWSTLHHVVGGVRSSLLHHALSQVWFEKHGQKLNQVVGSTLVVEKLLLLVKLASFHGFLVEVLLASQNSHFLGVAVLSIKSELMLEERVSAVLLGILATVLLLEVDEGLLRVWHKRDFGYLSTLTGLAEEDLKLLLCGSDWEVLDKQTEVHDGLLVLELVHLNFASSLVLSLGLADKWHWVLLSFFDL